MKTVLFVCSSNICRSPMAEIIFDELIDDHPRLRGRVKCESAGLLAFDGDDISPLARDALTAMGIDSSRHKAQRVSGKLIDDADIILTMEARQLDELLTLYPEVEDKSHTLKGYVAGIMGYPDDDSGEYDIIDPYRRIDLYDDVAEEIKETVIELLLMLDKEFDK